MIPRLTLLTLTATVLMASPPVDAVSPPDAVPMKIELIPGGDVAPRSSTAWTRGGVLYLSLNDLCLVLDAPKFWRSELGRMTVVVRDHEFSVTEGSDIAVIDDELFHLPGAVFFWEEKLMVPLDLILDESGKTQPWIDAPLRFLNQTLEMGKNEGFVTSAEMVREHGGWKLVLESDVFMRLDVRKARKSDFSARITGAVYDPILHPLPSAHPWFRELKIRTFQGGFEISFSPGPLAVGYSAAPRSGKRLEIFLGLDERDLREGKLRRFSHPTALVVQEIAMVAVDPGHGGSDRGAQLSGESEAALTWKLARYLERYLRGDLGVETMLTRATSDTRDGWERAAAANHAQADLFISLHVHTRNGGPAAFVSGKIPRGGASAPGVTAMGFIRFGTGQTPHLPASRIAGRFILSAVSERLGISDTGVHSESIPELSAAAMPAVMIELGTREKWTDRRLREVAEGIIDGLRLYRMAGDSSQ